VISVTISLNPSSSNPEYIGTSVFVFVFVFLGGRVSEFLTLSDQKNPVRLILRIFVKFFSSVCLGKINF
jgi:hypothetical protein